MFFNLDINIILRNALKYGGDFGEVYIEVIENYTKEILEKKENIDNSNIVGFCIKVYIKEITFFESSNNIEEIYNISNKIAEKIKMFSDKRCNIPLYYFNSIKNVRVKCNSFSYINKLEEKFNIKKKCLNDEIEKVKKDVNVSIVFSYTKKRVYVFNSKNVCVSDLRKYYSYHIVSTYNDRRYKSLIAKSGEYIENSNKYILEHVNGHYKAFINTQNSKKIKSGYYTVIIEHGSGGRLFHEIIGHLLEKSIFNISTPLEKCLGKKITSSDITLIDDGTIENGWGTSDYDDEGNVTQQHILIKNGILKNFICDNKSSQFYGLKYSGNSRRESFNYDVAPRMTNTYINNGKYSYKDILKQTVSCIYIKKLGEGRVNRLTGDYKILLEQAYLMKNETIDFFINNCYLVGNVMEVLDHVDMIANDLSFEAGMCAGRSGFIPTSVGAPTIRFNKLYIEQG